MKRVERLGWNYLEANDRCQDHTDCCVRDAFQAGYEHALKDAAKHLRRLTLIDVNGRGLPAVAAEIRALASAEEPE